MKRSEMWFTKDGQTIALVDMTDEHLDNAHAHLVRAVIRKVGDLNQARDAYDMGHINDFELDRQEEVVKKDLLYLEKDLNRIKEEKRRRM